VKARRSKGGGYSLVPGFPHGGADAVDSTVKSRACLVEKESGDIGWERGHQRNRTWAGKSTKRSKYLEVMLS
jgi:hypothetical protein